MSPVRQTISNSASARLIHIFLACLIFVMCTESSRVLAGKSPTTSPNRLQELPAFGVLVPPAPKGFAVAPELRNGMASAQIAKWTRAGTAGHEDQIVLWWAPIGMLSSFDEPVQDSFRTGAAVGLREPKEVKLPHPNLWPTLRFEGASDPSMLQENLVRKETVAVNNVAYVLSQYSPDGDTPETRAAFNEIAAGLAFEPPATLGESLRSGQRRVPVPGLTTKGVTICLPEPFRMAESTPHADAIDLTILTHRHSPPLQLDDFTAMLDFKVGTREVPERWGELPQAPPGWIKDNPDLRIARTIRWKQGTGGSSRQMCAFVGAQRLATDQWLWLSLVIPQRIVDQAGGDDRIVAILSETLGTVKLNNTK